VQIYKKVFFLWAILAVTTFSCAKDLAPQTVPTVPGKSAWRVNHEQRKRARQAYWSKRRNSRIIRKSDRNLRRLKKRSERAEAKLQKRHMDKQTPEVQKRMKETKKEADINNGKRTLRQRLRLWKYKK
jgi:hypothetical protein